MKNKGFISKKIIVFFMILALVIFLVLYFMKKVSKSADKLAQESASAIYDRANVYYINTMMLLDKEEFKCKFEDDSCDEIKFVSTTKPVKGYLNIYKGKVNAKLEYKKETYYICDNEVTKDEKCFIENYKNIVYRNIQEYYLNNIEDFEGYKCNFEKKKCDSSFSELYEQTGEILIDLNGNIEAKLSIGDNEYYICNEVSDNKDCLIDESINKIIESIKKYHTENNKDKKYNGFECDLDNCDELSYMTLTKPKGKISIDKNGKISGNLIYGEKKYFICDGKPSDKECK